MGYFKFRYTLRNGQSGSGAIEAPNYDSVGMLVRANYSFRDDVRVYDVEEIADEGESTDSRPAEEDGCA